MQEKTLSNSIKQLIAYAICHLGLKEEDQAYVENTIRGMIGDYSISTSPIDLAAISKMETADTIIDELKELLNGKEILGYPSLDHFVVSLFGQLTLMPSEMIRRFWEAYQRLGSSVALGHFFQYQIKNHYIQKKAVDLNKHWNVGFVDGLEIEVTINLSKPEKDNKETAKLLVQTEKPKYPACVLCYENIGYLGSETQAARGNLRVLPIVLNQEEWFMQYSPYQYYKEHCIVIDKIHRPMKMDKNTYIRFMDFLDLFPGYFIGSNAGLPIVGGTILNHEHYQGGNAILPMMKASDRFILEPTYYTDIQISYLEWPTSTMKLVSNNKISLIAALTIIQEKWESYNHSELEILAKSVGAQHSAITPIMRKTEEGYVAYVVLRNNRTNNEFPDGIFHVHPKYHGYKKESIGLIEAQGLFILPGRLDYELRIVAIEALKRHYASIEFFIQDYPQVAKHRMLIEELWKHRYTSLEEIQTRIESILGQACRSILESTSVFKNDERGNNAAKAFIASLGL